MKLNTTLLAAFAVFAGTALLGCSGGDAQSGDPGQEENTATSTSQALSANGWYKICHAPAGHVYLSDYPGGPGWPDESEHTGEWEYVHRLYSTYAYVGDNYGHKGWLSIGYLCDL